MSLSVLIVQEQLSINEAKTPAEQAHELGLIHIGWGYWAHEDDFNATPVARTLNGHLVQLSDGEKEQADADFSSKLDTDYPEVDQDSIDLGNKGTQALDTLADHAVAHADINGSHTYAVRTLIALSILKGKPAEITGYLASMLDDEQKADVTEFLTFVSQKGGKLTKAVAIAEKIRIYQADVHKVKRAAIKAKKEAEAAKQKSLQATMMPPAEKAVAVAKAVMTPEPEAPATQGTLSPATVVSMLGLDKNLLQNDQFIGLIQKLDKAKSGAAVNYIAQLLKGQHSQVKTPQFITQDQWKQLHKHLKDVKGGIKVGAANPGKKKAKLKVPTQPEVPTIAAPSPDVPRAKVKGPPEPEKNEAYYKKWVDSLPYNDKQELSDVWFKFLEEAGLTDVHGIGGAVAQGEVIQAVYDVMKNGNFAVLNTLENGPLSKHQVAILYTVVGQKFASEHEQPQEVPDWSWAEQLSSEETEVLNNVFHSVFDETHELQPQQANAVFLAIKHSIDNEDTVAIWNLDAFLDYDRIQGLRKSVIQAIGEKQDKANAAEFGQSVNDEKSSWLPSDYESWSPEEKNFVDVGFSHLQAEHWDKFGKDLKLDDSEKALFYQLMNAAYNADSSDAVAHALASLRKKGIIPNKMFSEFVDWAQQKWNSKPVAQTPETTQSAITIPDNLNLKDTVSHVLKASGDFSNLLPDTVGDLELIVATALETGNIGDLQKKLTKWADISMLTPSAVDALTQYAKDVITNSGKTPWTTEQLDTYTADSLQGAFGKAGVLKLDDAEKDMLKTFFKQAIELGHTDDLYDTLWNLYDNDKISSEVISKVMAAATDNDWVKKSPLTNVSATDVVTTPEAPVVNPLADTTIPGGAVKATNTLLFKMQNDPSKVLNWITGKIQADPKGTVNLKWVAMELVKNHGLSLADVPDEVIPYEMKDVLRATKIAPSSTPTPDAPTTPETPIDNDKITAVVDSMLSAYGGDIDATLDAVNKGLQTAYNNGNTDAYNGFVAMVNVLNQKKADVEAQQAPTASVDNETPVPPSTEEPKIEDNPGDIVGAKDAEAIVTTSLLDAGVQIDKLDPTVKTNLLKAAATALESPTEFGVHYAFLPLKGKIPDQQLDVVKQEILSQLEKEGSLDATPGAFKKYFDYEGMFDKMTKGEFSALGNMQASTPEQKQKFINFLKNATPEQRTQLIDAMKKGLSFTGPDGGKQAQKFYTDTLVNKMPGFDDDVYAVWRRALRGYHDELKQAEEFEAQKKAEAIKKKEEAEKMKKAAEELQKTLASIASGDSAGAIQSIMKSVGLDTLTPDMQKKALMAIHDALKAPSSTEAMNKIFAIDGSNAYTGNIHGGYYGGSALPKDKALMLRKLVASMWAEKHDPYNPTHEPKVSVPADVRAEYVLQNWADKYHTAIGHVSNKNQDKEQNALRAALVAALAEPDPKLVNSHLNAGLITGTSLTDDQISQLRKLVHQERQQPAALSGKQLKTWGKTSATTKPVKHNAQPSTSSVSADLYGNPEYSKKSHYYQFPAQKKQEIHNDIKAALTKGFMTTSKKSRDMFVDGLQHKLMQHGMDAKLARNAAMWVAREYEDNGPLAKAVKNALAKSGQQVVPAPQHHIPLPSAAEDQTSRTKVAALAPQYEYAKNEYVEGEHVKVHEKTGGYDTSFSWNEKSQGYSHAADADAKAQDTWRKQNLSTEDFQRFTWAANDWQGAGQWVNSAAQRKAVNDILTKTIEGPPPHYAKVNTFVERGMNMSLSDFENFIKAFRVGKPAYFGPSGFSANTGTAYGFGATPNGLHAQNVKVLMRVRPNAAGQIKAARVHQRSSHNSHPNEQELIVGTSKDFRTVAVTKHVIMQNGVPHLAYEIELQFEENINEALMTNEGFTARHWKGLSRDTIKALIKWMNTPLTQQPKA